jgi:alpha-D-ribose 1-methylphosphonate 5-triphosphate synthase subunit PhnH
MALQYRPLGIVTEMLEQIRVEVTYAYEDLVFIKDNHFLLQFGKVGEILFFHANIDTVKEDAQQLFATIQAVASAQGITLIHRGRYQLSAGEGENLSLQFVEDSEPEQ